MKYTRMFTEKWLCLYSLAFAMVGCAGARLARMEWGGVLFHLVLTAVLLAWSRKYSRYITEGDGEK